MWFEGRARALKSLAIAATILQFCGIATAADLTITPTPGSQETFLVLGGPDAGVYHPPPGGWGPPSPPEFTVHDVASFRDLTKPQGAKAAEHAELDVAVEMRSVGEQAEQLAAGPRANVVLIPLEGSHEVFIVQGLTGVSVICAPLGGWPTGSEVPVIDVVSITVL